jgi:hypothetical protein
VPFGSSASVTIAKILATICLVIYIPYTVMILVIDCCTSNYPYRGQREVYIVYANTNKHSKLNPIALNASEPTKL